MNKNKKLKYILGILFMFVAPIIWACPVCDRQKANQVTFGLSHGAGLGPDSIWGWVVVVGMIIITLLTLIFSIKYFIKPDNEKADRFKKSIFVDN